VRLYGATVVALSHASQRTVSRSSAYTYSGYSTRLATPSPHRVVLLPWRLACATRSGSPRTIRHARGVNTRRGCVSPTGKGAPNCEWRPAFPGCDGTPQCHGGRRHPAPPHPAAPPNRVRVRRGVGYGWVPGCDSPHMPLSARYSQPNRRSVWAISSSLACQSQERTSTRRIRPGG
jgi:hypothetical protein